MHSPPARFHCCKLIEILFLSFKISVAAPRTGARTAGTKLRRQPAPSTGALQAVAARLAAARLLVADGPDLKARLLLGLALREGAAGSVAGAFAAYQ